MNILIEKNVLVNTALGKQSVDSNKIYRKLSFVQIVEIDGVTIAYNNLTKEMIALDDAEIGLFEKSTVIPDSNNFELIENWFFVPVENNDSVLSDQLCELAKIFQASDYVNNFVILPTSDCNARCFYCFEADAVKSNMSKQTALEVAEYIKKVSKGHKIVIRWFGGEPLYNVEVIDIICEKLREFNLEYQSMIVTNAFLFTPEMVLRAKDLWNLTFAQITLDGTEKIYNRTKNYINCEGLNPFEIVLCNIYELISNQIHVKIRLNMDKHNSSDLYDLLDLLYKRFPDTTYLTISASLLFEDLGYYKIKHNDDERKKLNAEFFALEDYIEEKGFRSNSKLKNFIKIHACMSDDDSFVLISPLGDLGKCEHYVSEHFFGRIDSDDVNCEEINYWKARRQKFPECETCVCYPTCFYSAGCNTHQKVCDDFERENSQRKLIRKIKGTYRQLNESNFE